MTLKLITKPSVQDDIKQDVIKYLRETLEIAERGEVASVVIIAKRADGYWQHRRSGVIDFSDMIGKLEIIKQDMIESYRKEHE